MNETIVLKRIKRAAEKKPNPLFEKWLEEWRKEAKGNGSEMQHCFARALRSLRKFPFALQTGRECMMLEHFGAKLCAMLDKRLEEHRKMHPEDRVTSSGEDNSESEERGRDAGNKRKNCMDSPVRTVKCAKDSRVDKEEGGGGGGVAKRSGTYVPAYRSGAYALLLTLHECGCEMTKSELESKAQDLCDASFKKSGDSNYTAWSSMATLVKKGLVDKNGRPARFKLTERGVDVTRKLKNQTSATETNTSSDVASRETPNANLDLSAAAAAAVAAAAKESSRVREDASDGTRSEKCDAKPKARERAKKTNGRKREVTESQNCDNRESQASVLLAPHTFDVVLFVDAQEIDNKQGAENDKIVKYLSRRKVNFEVKHLSVGDYLWVCRDRKTKSELVLPYIVERKRMDDLAMSIRDGRFHEQKFRLKQSGLENRIYLVEKYGNDGHRLGLPLATIQQAVSNTSVVDGFDVKLTRDSDDTLSYLSGMTASLAEIFRGKTLVACRKKDLPPFDVSADVASLVTFSDFNKDSGKMRRFTVRNMFVKHLLQLRGLSVDKAKAIAKAYPTPRSMIEAFERAGNESVVADLTYGPLNRCIGSSLAKSLHRLYTSKELT